MKTTGRDLDVRSVFRRVFHVISPVFLGYYLLPESLGGGITRTSVTLLFVGTAACIEIGRIALGIRLFGMRPYEGQRLSAYAQGTLGLAVGLLLIRDPAIVVPVFLGMAWIDPLAALARKKKWPRGLVVGAYFGLFFATEFVMNVVPSFTWQFVLAAVATAAAMLMEGPKHPKIDDDLLMLVVPMAILWAIAAIFRPPGLLEHL
ncbi:MAG: hypothetical protein ACREDF_05655 [Thermoplasmata archaeon]